MIISDDQTYRNLGFLNNSLPHDEYYAARACGEVFIRAVPALPRILARHGYDCLQTGKFWEGHHKNARPLKRARGRQS